MLVDDGLLGAERPGGSAAATPASPSSPLPRRCGELLGRGAGPDVAAAALDAGARRRSRGGLFHRSRIVVLSRRRSAGRCPSFCTHSQNGMHEPRAGELRRRGARFRIVASSSRRRVQGASQRCAPGSAALRRLAGGEGGRAGERVRGDPRLPPGAGVPLPRRARTADRSRRSASRPRRRAARARRAAGARPPRLAGGGQSPVARLGVAAVRESHAAQLPPPFRGGRARLHDGPRAGRIHPPRGPGACRVGRRPKDLVPRTHLARAHGYFAEPDFGVVGMLAAIAEVEPVFAELEDERGIARTHDGRAFVYSHMGRFADSSDEAAKATSSSSG